MYKCESPICDGYKTNYRSQIHRHHIIPVECGGTNKNSNFIFLCPNCHSHIFVEDSRNGIHTIRGNDSIILKRWLTSTDGRVLEYIDKNNNLQYYFIHGD